MKNNDSKENILEKSGLKKTGPRLRFIEFFQKNKKPSSALDIFNTLSKEDIDKVTIYRTLESFLKKGIIKRVDTGKREAEYELIDEEHDHHHIICIKCKKIEDFTGCDSEIFVKNALKTSKNFKNITHHSFDLFGICNSCNKQ